MLMRFSGTFQVMSNFKKSVSKWFPGITLTEMDLCAKVIAVTMTPLGILRRNTANLWWSFSVKNLSICRMFLIAVTFYISMLTWNIFALIPTSTVNNKCLSSRNSINALHLLLVKPAILPAVIIFTLSRIREARISMCSTISKGAVGQKKTELLTLKSMGSYWVSKLNVPLNSSSILLCIYSQIYQILRSQPTNPEKKWKEYAPDLTWMELLDQNRVTDETIVDIPPSRKVCPMHPKLMFQHKFVHRRSMVAVLLMAVTPPRTLNVDRLNNPMEIKKKLMLKPTRNNRMHLFSLSTRKKELRSMLICKENVLPLLVLSVFLMVYHQCFLRLLKYWEVNQLFLSELNVTKHSDTLLLKNMAFVWMDNGESIRAVCPVFTLMMSKNYSLMDVSIAGPECKWIFISGSPCQDLTIAGPTQGVVGICGKQSSLFFYVHLAIWFIQMKYSAGYVRFLAENAGSMQHFHKSAIKEILGLEKVSDTALKWDTSLHFGIRRERYFFRNYDDSCSVISQNYSVFGEDGFGPLRSTSNQPIALGPLLRVREDLGNNILRLSWTSYQPISLFWDYSFWGGDKKFAELANLKHNARLPALDFTLCLPPLWFADWKEFLSNMYRKGINGHERDAMVVKLLPLFCNKNVRIPFRTLTVEEVLKFAGLTGHFDSIKTNKQLLTDRNIHDFCGNTSCSWIEAGSP